MVPVWIIPGLFRDGINEHLGTLIFDGVDVPIRITAKMASVYYRTKQESLKQESMISDLLFFLQKRFFSIGYNQMIRDFRLRGKLGVLSETCMIERWLEGLVGYEFVRNKSLNTIRT